MPKYGDKKKVVSKLQVPQLEEIREVPHNSYSDCKKKKKKKKTEEFATEQLQVNPNKHPTR